MLFCSTRAMSRPTDLAHFAILHLIQGRLHVLRNPAFCVSMEGALVGGMLLFEAA